ncbi:hypothetical protein JCM10212_000709 [Sporobolomyces blumeae]
MSATVPYPLVHSYLLVKRLISLNKPASTRPARHYIFLKGAEIRCRDDSDREYPFEQERNFSWLTGGLAPPHSALTISYEHPGGERVNVNAIETRLWLPDVDEAEVMWCGLPPTPEQLGQDLHVTAIHQGWSLQSLYPPPPSNRNLDTIIHHLPSTQPPTSISAQINAPRATSEFLLKALHEARRNKTPTEVEKMKKASEITAGAHKTLMELVGKGEVKDENAAEADFISYCRKRGSKHQAYSPIMAAGKSAGTLHYVANDATFPTEPTLLLVDAGCEWQDYTSDVTRVIPIGNGGKFMKECAEITTLVCEMQEAAFAMIKPGCNWEDVQRLMHDVLIRGFLKLGLFVADGSSEDEKVEKIKASGLSSAFYPHGVGHLLGLDTHDVGGLPEGRSTDPLLKYLRLRVPLEEGFVVTVEPGCYFNEHLFAPFKNSEFVNHDLLEQYKYVGGVRIEDNLLVTADGYENLTPSWLPKTVAEVEAVTTAGRS